MGTWEIDGERSRLEVGTRPGQAGLRIVVAGLAGAIEATFTGDDGPTGVDLDQPVHGTFSLRVDELGAGDSLVAPALRQWLGDRTALDVHGEVTAVRPHDGHRYDVLFTVHLGDRAVPLKGLGRARARPDGTVELDGTTIADPRAFGLSLPPLLNLMAHIRWRLVLRPRGG